MCETLTDFLCQYRSIRFITVKNKKLATIYYILILLVLFYVIGYTVIYSKGYQIIDNVTGVTSIRIKGSGAIGNGTDLIPLDSMDLRNPPHELDALFITTAMTVTPNQTQTICDGPDDTPSCTTHDTTNCTETLFTTNSHGMFTGECGSNDRCELHTWCPIEDDTKMDVVQNIGNFTLFVKILASFNRWGIKTTNIYDINGDGSPIYGYNLFTVNDILDRATNGQITDYMEIAESGAILMVSSVWNCNFDRAISECQPDFRFKRVGGESNTISSGFSFHTVNYDVTNRYRLLKKLHGLRIMFVVEGHGGKFNLAALGVTIGAGLAYLGLAKFVTDVILDNFMGENSSRYSELKYTEIDEPLDEEPVITPSASHHTDTHYQAMI